MTGYNDNDRGNVEGNYIAEGMGDGYRDIIDGGDSAIAGPQTSAGDIPLDLEAPTIPASIGATVNSTSHLDDPDGGSNFDVYQFNDLTNTATTTTTTTSTDDGAVNMDIIKEFDRDYMKLRGRLIDLIEKQSHGKTSNVNNIQKSSSVELLDSNDHE